MPNLGEVTVTSRHGGGTLVSVDTAGNVVFSGTVTSDPVTDHGAPGMATDVIAESTAAAGVTIDSLLIKDGYVVAIDAQGVKLGTGVDDTIAHNGTLTTWTHTTGDLLIDNTDVNDQTIFRVGTDTSATGVEFRNDSDAAMWAISPSSASAGTLKGLDGSALVLGTGNDDSVQHNATDTIWTQATGELVFDNTLVTGKTAIRLGTDTAATQFDVRNDSDAAMVSVTGAGVVTLADGSTLLRPGAGTGTGDVLEVIGPDVTHGMKISVYEATLSPAAVETALFTVPAMSVIDSVQANVQTALTGGGTTATFSIGITGDVDLYGTAGTAGAQADLLAQNSKLDCFGTRASNHGAGIGLFVAATQALKLIGAATGGATAGDTALTVGTVKVRVVYRTLMALVNA